MESLSCSRRIMLLAGLMAALGAAAADEPPQAPLPHQGERAGRNTQPMDLKESMPTGMAKKGMKKGDVMKAEESKKAYMEEMMKQEKAAAGARGR